MNYYEILQVTQDASDEVISAAYKSLVKKYHPDSGFEKDSEKFLQIEEAYAVLSDVYERKRYDETLHQQKTLNVNKREEPKFEMMQNTEEYKYDGKSEKNEKNEKGNCFSTLFSILFWIFVIACFVTNMEQYRMKIYNAIGKYEFNAEQGNCNVTISVEYEEKLLKRTPKVWLNVDGKRVQVIQEGDQYDYKCKLSPGKHIVFAETKLLHANSEIYTFTVLPESELTRVDCIIKGRSNWGVAFTMDGTYQ